MYYSIEDKLKRSGGLVFGRQDDVIRQDQKRTADVQLPDDAFAVLTAAAPNDSASTDNPAAEELVAQPQPSNQPSRPSIDGISGGPTNSLASPFDLMEAHKRAIEKTSEPQQSTPAAAPEAQSSENFIPEPAQPQQDQPENTQSEDETLEELSYAPQEEHNLLTEETTTHDMANYLSNLDGVDADELQKIKQSALQQLSPLVDQLALEPEDKFKTLMMLIQASDNQALIPLAYGAAQKIEDEKVRAQALLDVVNEINYFTKIKNASSEQNEA